MRKCLADEVFQSSGDPVRSETADDKQFLEWLLLKTLPVERKLFVLWSKLVVPVLETLWRFSCQMMRELLEHLNLDELLDGVPSEIGQPFFAWVWHISLCWAVDQEVHVLLRVFNNKLLLLHKTECKLVQENQLVTHKQTARHPLVHSETNALSECSDTRLDFFECLSLFNGFEEESCKGLKRVLVHVIDNAKLDQQKVKHGTFSGDATIHFSHCVDVEFSLFGFNLLLLNSRGSLFGGFERLNQLFVLQNSC